MRIYLLSILTLCLMSSCFNLSKWGNKIEFVNETGLSIDSLSFSVCGTKSMIYTLKQEDGSVYFEENPTFPDSGYPCPVGINVFADGQIITLVADPFDCYHCDAGKRYIL